MLISAQNARLGTETRVRRFEPGATGIDFLEFLRECGWEVKHRHGVGSNSFTMKRLGEPGRPRVVGKHEVIRLVDTERQQRGLEPLRVENREVTR